MPALVWGITLLVLGFAAVRVIPVVLAAHFRPTR